MCLLRFQPARCAVIGLHDGLCITCKLSAYQHGASSICCSVAHVSIHYAGAVGVGTVCIWQNQPYVFLPAGAQNGHNTVARKAAGAANNTTYGQASSVQQLAEALASSVILAALKPGKLLDRLAEAAGSAAAGGPLPRNTTQFKQWRSIEAALMQWRAVPGSVLAMLAVFAYNQLLASYRGAAGKQ